MANYISIPKDLFEIIEKLQEQNKVDGIKPAKSVIIRKAIKKSKMMKKNKK